MFDFTGVQDLIIPEGRVARIIDKIDNSVVWSLLPSEYQQVEYIAVTGTQYINTNWTPSNNTLFKIKYMPTPSNGYVFGCGSNPRLAASGGQFYNTSNGADGIYSFSISVGSIVEFESYCTSDNTTDTYVKVNGVEKRNNIAPQTNFNTATHMFLGAWEYNTSTIRYGACRLYKAEARVNGVKVFDMIPCYRKADGVIGMYDIVSKSFFTNAGSGNFTKGADV